MRHQYKQRLTKELLTMSRPPDPFKTIEEMLIKELTVKLIHQIPLEDLKRIFKIRVYDPDSAECKKMTKDINLAVHIRQLLWELKVNNLIEITVSIELP